MAASRIASALAFAAAVCTPAEARSESPVSYYVEVLVDGVARPQIFDPKSGKTSIEAMKGREYVVRVTNKTAQRVAAVVAVDGLNSFDAKSATAPDAVRWIIRPFDSITIKGWQVGNDRLRRFEFSTVDKSYGASLGKTSELGKITVAVYREKQQGVPRYVAKAPASKATGAGLGSAGSAPAATTQGRSETNVVRMVNAELESTPAATFAIHYEYPGATKKNVQNVQYAPEQR